MWALLKEAEAILGTRKGRGGRNTTPSATDAGLLGDTQSYINTESFEGFVSEMEDVDEGREGVGGSAFPSLRIVLAGIELGLARGAKTSPSPSFLMRERCSALSFRMLPQL